MDITHLVVNGCSWTYCQGLADPKTQGWPALLAKKLGVPVVNLAVRGSGNDTIHRRTYEYCFEDVAISKPLYVIAWSQTWRREAWCRKQYNNSMPDGYCSIAMPNDSPQNHNEYALLDNWSDEDFYRRLMLYRASLNSLFTARNIPNITSFFADPNNIYKADIDKKFANLSKFLDVHTNIVKPFHEITGQYPVLPCGHDGYEAMPVLADFIFDQITRLYGEVNPIPSNFLSLGQFEKIDSTGTAISDNNWI